MRPPVCGCFLLAALWFLVPGGMLYNGARLHAAEPALTNPLSSEPKRTPAARPPAAASESSSWLTAETVKIAATGAAMALAALGWVLMLRRRVQQQNERIAALSRENELETRYRELFESQPYMFYRTGVDGRIELCSPACERLLGYTSEEMAGKPARELYYSQADRESLLHQVLTQGSVSDAEVQFVRKNGEVGIFSVNARTIRNAAGQLVATEGFVRDITARKHAEQKARHSEAMTRIINYFATSLLEQDTEESVLWDLAKNCVAKLGFVDCVIYLKDEEGRTLLQKAAFGPKNPEGREILNPIAIPLGEGIVGAVGKTGKAELIGDTNQDPRYILDDERRYSELTVPIVADGTVIGVIDSEHPAKNFFTTDHLEIVTAIASLCANKLVRVKAEQRVRAMNVELEQRVATRTAELKKANAELQESEAHVRLIIDTALDAVITMDGGGLIRGWNAQAETIFGWKAAEAIGRPLATTIIPPQLREAHERGIRHYRATGEGPVLNKRIEITALHRGGREFPVELTIAPMVLGSETIFSAFVRDITERKRAEAALQENEIRLRVMLKHAPEAIGMVDLDTGRFVEPNDVAARLCGVDQETLLTLGPTEVSPPMQPDGEPSERKLRRHIDEAMAGGAPVFEWLHRSVKGVEAPCEMRLVRMPIPGRRLVRYSITEISERKRAEKRREAFSALGERLSGAASVDEAAAIITEVSDHLFGWDSCSFDLYSAEQDRTFSILTMDLVDGKRVSVPPTVTGATPSAIMRRTIGEGAQLILRSNPQQERSPQMIPFGDAGRASASLMFVPIRNGAHVTGTLSIQSYTPFAYNQGDLETLQALADYCSAAIERIQAEHQFRSIFENAVEGIWRAAPEGRFLAANPALARMLGYASPDELILSITDPGRQLYVDAAQWREFTHLLNANDVVVGFETEFYRKDGGRIWISQSGRTVRDTRKTLRHYEGTLEEITERKRVESELLKALAKEKELGELKSNFVSMVSHEFRTPLEVIMSSGEILERYLDRLNPAQRREHLQAIHKNVRRMAGLMEEVLVLTKVDAGKMEFKPMALDLEGFCRRLVDEILSATSYQCPIEFAAENLPATAQGDEGLLRHIFQNLLSNAVKYSPGGTPVRFSVKYQLGQALFRVEDQGLGIPAGDQARLFQSFYRGKNVEHLSGTGLGLVIVKRCVQLHGGKIHFQSVEGKGTIFTVWLPLFGEVLDSSFETSFLAKQTR